jgi:cytochrome c biogenesis protein CcmG, thiol:disulfide interchange protein DsbE
MNRFLLPLGVFVVLVGFFFVGLKLNPREVPSPLIGKPAPQFNLPRLDAVGSQFGPENYRGKVWLLNVWASWCVACREEHPLLVELARQGTVNLIGLNYKDNAVDAQSWLSQFGNPYQLSVMDADGRVGIEYGVYGVPETFIIDKQGIIAYKVIGPITTEILQNTVLPKVAELSSR